MTHREQQLESALRALMPHVLAIHDHKRHPQEMTLAIQFAQAALATSPVQVTYANNTIQFPTGDTQ